MNTQFTRMTHWVLASLKKLISWFFPLTHTLLLLTLLAIQLETSENLHQCGTAPEGWQLIRTRPNQKLCADVLESLTPEKTHLLRIFSEGELDLANLVIIPCRLCDMNPGALAEADTFHDLDWVNDTLRVTTGYGIQDFRTETWSLEKKDGVWILSNWERALTDLTSGALWSEETNLLERSHETKFSGIPNQEFCSTASAGTLGCRSGKPIPPVTRSCSNTSLSTDISRIIEYRNSDWACEIRSMNDPEMSDVPPHHGPYTIVPLEDFVPEIETEPVPEPGQGSNSLFARPI